ncbi:hypothetical protein [Xanthomonas albilineans]|uniref:hypothetical protein n=1 Tax=Xanthomonas albilineans TaxID=29447 RepID=UPI0005F33B95|nr:hypothetical protein [Xanthomonas albilineans]
MTDLLLRDIDPLMFERIGHIAVARGLTQHQTVLALIEQGLFASEQDLRKGFKSVELDALSEAITALRALPSGVRL